MTDQPEEPIESDMAGESKEERTTRRNFYSDSVRAGLHSAGVDILEQMQAGGVPDAASCLLSGACMFIAELYEETATKLGADKGKFRAHLLESVDLYFTTYSEMTVKESLSRAVAQAKGKGERVQ